MRMLRPALALFLFLIPASAQQRGGGWVDPMVLQPITAAGALLNGKVTLTPRNQSVNTGIKNLVLIVAGQSNLTDVAPSAYSPANPTKIDQMNILDGGVYPAVDPLLGCSLTFSGGNPSLRVADNFIATGTFDRVLLVPIAIGGSSVADWATGTSSDRIKVALLRLAAKGFTAQTNVTVAIIWGQGETDNTLGTSQANYTSRLNTVIANAATAGFTGRWFIAKQSWDGTVVSVNVQNAQVAAIGGSVFAGPNADALIGTACSGVACRANPDAGGGINLHWSDAGSISYADNTVGWQFAMHASGAPF